MEPTEGDSYTHERTFSPEEVRRFGDLSGGPPTDPYRARRGRTAGLRGAVDGDETVLRGIVDGVIWK